MQAPGNFARGAGFNTVRSHRDVEYDAFSRVTRDLQRASRGEMSLARAAAANADLWSTLAADLADDGNDLPDDLKARLLSLAIFSIRQSHRAIAGNAEPAALIDVNLAIMKGLRGEVAA